MALTLADSNRIMTAAIAKAEELDIKISVAVVDAGGRLIGLQRMDGAIWASAYGCQGKGRGLLRFRSPQRRDAGPRRCAHPGRHQAALRFRNDSGTGRGAGSPGWRRSGRLRRGRRHQRGGRAVRGRRRRRFVAGQPDPAAFRFIRKAIWKRGAANFG